MNDSFPLLQENCWSSGVFRLWARQGWEEEFLSFIRLDDIVGKKSGRISGMWSFLQVWSCFCCLQADCKLKTITAIFHWVSQSQCSCPQLFLLTWEKSPGVLCQHHLMLKLLIIKWEQPLWTYLPTQSLFGFQWLLCAWEIKSIGDSE